MAFPPSLPESEILKTSVYHHAPKIDEKVILGVDEAGRGPVLGPMVYAAAYCGVSFKDELAELGFDDSKVLTAEKRDEMMHAIVEEERLVANIGWSTAIMTAQDISSGMFVPGGTNNLNAQAHNTTMDIIQRILDSGVEVAEAYIDTVGPPASYQAKLSARFPSIRFTVAKKADSLYPIVSCASICAKVTRDASLHAQIEGCGSGYPSDPNTVTWLKANMDPMFGWGPLVRYSWSTAKDMLDKTGYLVEWASDQNIKPVEPGPVSQKGLPSVGLDWFGRCDQLTAE